MKGLFLIYLRVYETMDGDILDYSPGFRDAFFMIFSLFLHYLA